jgi:hypothetical protein
MEEELVLRKLYHAPQALKQTDNPDGGGIGTA